MASQEEEIEAEGAGSVTVRLSGGRLELVSVKKSHRWSAKVLLETSTKVQVRFSRGRTRVTVTAWVSGGELQTRVRKSRR